MKVLEYGSSILIHEARRRARVDLIVENKKQVLKETRMI